MRAIFNSPGKETSQIAASFLSEDAGRYRNTRLPQALDTPAGNTRIGVFDGDDGAGNSGSD